MGQMWENPSRRDEIWDRNNNVHVQPGSQVYMERQPDTRNTQFDRLVAVTPGQAPGQDLTAPVVLTAAIQIEDTPPPDAATDPFADVGNPPVKSSKKKQP